MSNEHVFAPVDKTALPNDLLVVRDVYQFPSFHYYDIHQNTLPVIIFERWPLLNELMQKLVNENTN